MEVDALVSTDDIPLKMCVPEGTSEVDSVIVIDIILIVFFCQSKNTRLAPATVPRASSTKESEITS